MCTKGMEARVTQCTDFTRTYTEITKRSVASAILSNAKATPFYNSEAD